VGKGSPRDYDAETGCLEQSAQKSQLGEPHECYPLYRTGRTQENHQLLHKDSSWPNCPGGQIAGFPVSASKLGGRLAGAMVWGDGSHAAQCLDLRHAEALCRATGHGAPGKDDLHAQDLSEGNSILIGGPNSNPWAPLFTDRTNFRHVDDSANHKHCLENLRPAPGEQLRYENTYSNQSVGYLDGTSAQNPSRSGYILMINGADMQANDAAARFLLHGRLPPGIAEEPSRKDLHYFEFLLRGRQITGEADYSVELVTVR
jgi:hypothetical protein